MTTTTRKLHLDLEEDVNVLLDLVRKQCSEEGGDSTTTKVTIEYWGDEPLAEDVVLRPILASLRQVFSLRHLQMTLGDCCLEDGVGLPVRLLTQVLNDCSQLQSLCLDSIRLVASSLSEWEDLAEATRTHPCLTRVSMTMMAPQLLLENNNGNDKHDQDEEDLIHPSLLHSFWTALAQLPTMQILELDDTPVSGPSLERLCQSPYLQELELWNLPEVIQQIAPMTAALIHNGALTKLDISSCNLLAAASHALVDMLMQNKTLRVVVAHVEWDDGCMFGCPIASVLRHNATLQELHLTCRQGRIKYMQPGAANAHVYAGAICQGFEHNSTLKRLSLDIQQSRSYRNDNSRLFAAFCGPLAKVLETNTSLEYVRVKGGRNPNHVTWSPKVQFYLTMNQSGRAIWLQGLLDDCVGHHKESSFLESFLESKHHEDVSTWFYLLSIHPPLCQALLAV